MNETSRAFGGLPSTAEATIVTNGGYWLIWATFGDHWYRSVSYISMARWPLVTTATDRHQWPPMLVADGRSLNACIYMYTEEVSINQTWLSGMAFLAMHTWVRIHNHTLKASRINFRQKNGPSNRMKFNTFHVPAFRSIDWMLTWNLKSPVH